MTKTLEPFLLSIIADVVTLEDLRNAILAALPPGNVTELQEEAMFDARKVEIERLRLQAGLLRLKADELMHRADVKEARLAASERPAGSFLAFLSENVVERKESDLSIGDLHGRYTGWSERQGLRANSAKRLVEYLAEQYSTKMIGGRLYVSGLALRH